MKKFFISLLLVIVGSAGFGKIWTVSNVGITFSPETITISVGDSVRFDLEGDHNAVEVSQATWNANGSTSLSGGFSVSYGGGTAFPSKLTAGTHYYVCSPHASLGMKGKIIVQIITGIALNSGKKDISIFPNPSNGIFRLYSNSAFSGKNVDVLVYNILGNKVFERTYTGPQNQFRIDASNLPKGTYIMRLNGSEEIYTRKIVIQ